MLFKIEKEDWPEKKNFAVSTLNRFDNEQNFLEVNLFQRRGHVLFFWESLLTQLEYLGFRESS